MERPRAGCRHGQQAHCSILVAVLPHRKEQVAWHAVLARAKWLREWRWCSRARVQLSLTLIKSRPAQVRPLRCRVIRHTTVTKANAERAVLLELPPVDERGRACRPRDLDVFHFRKFLVDEMAADLVSMHNAKDALQHLGGEVPPAPLGSQNDDDVQQLSVGVLMLAGDGQLRSINVADATSMSYYPRSTYSNHSFAFRAED